MSSQKKSVANATKKKKGTSSRKTKGPKVPSSRGAVPVAFSTATQGSSPRITSSGDSITVSHREFFLQVSKTSATDEVNYWTINPAWNTMFPWLSNLAQNYERYEFTSLSFEYVPRVPTTTAGEVILVVDPDPDDGCPAADISGKSQLLAHRICGLGNTWAPLTIHIPAACLRERGGLYTRHPTLTETVEARTTDLGNLFVGTFGCPASTTLGSVFVSYSVRLFVSQLPVVASTPAEQSKVGTNALSSTQYFGDVDATGTAVRNLMTVAGGNFTSATSPGAPFAASLMDTASKSLARTVLAAVVNDSGAYWAGCLTFQFCFSTPSVEGWSDNTSVYAQVINASGTVTQALKAYYFSYSCLVSATNGYGCTLALRVPPNLLPIDGATGVQICLQSPDFTSGIWTGCISRVYFHWEGSTYIPTTATIRALAPASSSLSSSSVPLLTSNIGLTDCSVAEKRHQSFVSEMNKRAQMSPFLLKEGRKSDMARPSR